MIVILHITGEEDTPAVQEAKALEAQGVQAAEGGDITLALAKFSEAITACPQRASGYNNRAQALRLHGDVQGLHNIFTSDNMFQSTWMILYKSYALNYNHMMYGP